MKLLFLLSSRVGFLAVLLLSLAACHSGKGKKVVISGQVTYDRVSFDAGALQGLDYSQVELMPIRGATVQLLGAEGQVLTSTVSGANGDYLFSGVAANTEVQVRVVAELRATAVPVWSINVLDNTSANAQYVLDGALLSAGSTDSLRNLHASSGWNSADAAYTGIRAAAPFAILDTIYFALQQLIAVDTALVLSPLKVFWSPVNNPAIGLLAEGDIGGSFYKKIGGEHRIYLLGAEDQNTDEYDTHVIMHEWAHFFEHELSRTDTLGGKHNITESLDMRVAFSEGFANAFSAIMTNDNLYRDSYGVGQSEGFPIYLEDNPNPASDNAGWFVESSIHSLLYDIYDDDNEGDDAISAGFQSIYDVLTSSAFIEQTSLTSLFSFAALLRNHPLINASDLDALLASQAVYGDDAYGENESNDGGYADNLPVYSSLTINGASQQLGTTNTLAAREVNKLGNRQFVRLSPAVGSLTIDIAGVSGFFPSNPALIVHRRGSIERQNPVPNTSAYSANVDSLSTVMNLSVADEYILEVFSRDNIDNDIFTGGDVCFSVTATQ